MIAILDTGGANHSSIQNALARLDRESEITLELSRLEAATHLILPGVGHAGYAMERLASSELQQFLLSQEKPVLGICLGMQLLFSQSEEGPAKCLGLLPGSVTRLEPQPGFRVPHMGWTTLRKTGAKSRLLEEVDENSYFYFVHSYQVPKGEWIVAESQPPYPLPAVLEHRNFFATQFHPERSGAAGTQVLKNFLRQGGRR